MRIGWHLPPTFPTFLGLMMLAGTLLLLARPETASAAAITVTTTADTFDTGDGACSLPEAITNANANNQSGSPECAAGEAGPTIVDAISFSIPGPGVKTINVVAGGLPTITDAVVIDGYTQGTAQPNTLAVGTDAKLLIELVLLDIHSPGPLTISAPNTTVRGLIINRCLAPACIVVTGLSATNVHITGNYVGTTADGSAASTDLLFAGIQVIGGASHVTIGGTTPPTRNVISGHPFYGVRVEEQFTTDVTIQGNYIGLNAAGTSGIGDSGWGIYVNQVPNVTIGGAVAGAGNVIGGNREDGIQLISATNAVVQGNLIGTDATGSVGILNGYGIRITNTSGATIGGTSALARNVIAASRFVGITIPAGITKNLTIQGNYIGLNAAGTATIRNGTGINLEGASDTLIGGTTPGAGNVISGAKEQDAIAIGSADGHARVQGNLIGTNADGTAVLGNVGNGISVAGLDVTIGGAVPEARNVIVGSSQAGIHVTGLGAVGLTVQGNAIGVLGDGTTPAANLGDGIFAESARSAMIGGTTPGAGNVIAFNSGRGILMPTSAPLGAVVSIRQNSIFSNGGLGIDLGATGVTTNDGGDGDAGPNALQNFPVLTSAILALSQGRISGTLNSVANTTFQIDLYSSPACDASGHGEGKVYLGTAPVTTDDNGNGTFFLTGLGGAIDGGVITATATDPGQRTSEFSACRAIQAPSLILSQSDLGVVEGSANAFTVRLNGVPSQPVTFNVTFDAGKVSASPTMLTFPADATAVLPQTVTVSALNDQMSNGARDTSVGVTSSSADPAFHNRQGLVAVSIADDEPSPTLALADVSVTEPASASGTTPATLTVTLQPSAAKAVTVQFATANGTATGGATCTGGVDYLTTSGTLTFTAGDTSKTIPLTICGDDVPEPDETLTVMLSNPTGGGVLGQHSQATVTIVNSGGVAPLAAADSYATAAGSPLSVPSPGVLANDTEVGPAGPLRAQVVTPPSHGGLTLAPDGGFTYRPDGDFAGVDAFTYVATNGPLVSAPVTVTIAVTATRCAPRPRVQSVPLAGGGQLQVTVQASPLGTGAPNAIAEIEFGALQNAQVTLNGQPIGSGQVVGLPADTTTVTFVVRRRIPGQPTTVPFTVKDACGSWPSFVGGGAAAGF